MRGFRVGDIFVYLLLGFVEKADKLRSIHFEDFVKSKDIAMKTIVRATSLHKSAHQCFLPRCKL